MKIKALELVRKIRNENYEKSKGMTSQEKIEYTRKLAKKFSKKALHVNSVTH
ncbi:MAG: hypothetical protein SCARUB_00836 [Candidatus Scalindua rubra]|uniref:Uncharacterized protein n=1 Tax=Candidatus Scalindua rubra TaxID=1872076 RepID=A0A1E3XEL3_9BACT|nr:MAG: hypothetical protein SCARUB_00836 [Candidatus Scalindua rubra]